jgi:DNA-binding MarR family transcriptional regulator
VSTDVSGLEALEVQTFISLLRAHATVTRALSGELVSAHGLTINDYEVLLRLMRAPDRMMRRVDLAQQVLLTPSGITRLLDGLECEGLVEKASCATDARVSYAKLTDAGAAKLREASESHFAGICDLLRDRFDAQEIATLHQLLSRLQPS